MNPPRPRPFYSKAHGAARRMTTGSVPRKRSLDALFEESGIDMTSALALLSSETDNEVRTKDNANLETSAFPFNQDTISQNPWGPQQDIIDSLTKACMSPLSQIRDDLIKLYFIHVHPVCPVVDEYNFTILYRHARSDEELLTYIELPLLQAMLFTALAHINQSLLDATPYSSIHEAQESHFEFTRALYRYQICNKPYVLAQVTLLLTFWSPCDSELQVNSYWLDRAYYHAREAGVWNLQTSTGFPSDRRAIIWWCCLIRDRMLAIGMRRPHQLHQVQNVRGMLTETDFGLEALLPSYSSLQSKKRMMSVFLAFCRLSEILADTAEYQSRFRFSRQWESRATTGFSGADEIPIVTKFETRLKEWKQSFEDECRLFDNGRIDDVYASTVCLIRLIASGLLLILYQPWLQWWSSVPFEAKDLWELSLRKLKEGTQDVVASVQQLTATASLESVPAFITSWITLPTAIYCTMNHIKVDSPRLELKKSERHLLPALLKSMVSRCQGAEFACILINECIEEPHSEQTQSVTAHSSRRSSQLEGSEEGTTPSESPIRNSSTRAEAILLSRVVRSIDSGLANDINDKILHVRASESPPVAKPLVRETVDVAQSATKLSPVIEEDGRAGSPRAIIKYKALYNGSKVFQSAAIFATTTPFSFAEMLEKTAVVANRSALKDGRAASQIECRATIMDTQDGEGSEVEIDIESDQDWEVISSIVTEWWTTQQKRHIVINVDVQYA